MPYYEKDNHNLREVAIRDLLRRAPGSFVLYDSVRRTNSLYHLTPERELYRFDIRKVNDEFSCINKPFRYNQRELDDENFSEITLLSPPTLSRP